MRQLILICGIVALGLIIGPILWTHSGYVLFAIGQYTVEMTLVSFIVVLIAVLASLSLMFRLKKVSVSAIHHSGNWLKQRKQVKAQSAMTGHILNQFIVNWQKHQSQLTDKIDDLPDTPLGKQIQSILLLQQDRYQEAEALLEPLLGNHPVGISSHVILLISATQRHDWEIASRHLLAVPSKHPLQSQTVDVEITATLHCQGLEDALTKLDTLKAHLNDGQFSDWQVSIFEHDLTTIASNSGGNDMIVHWNSFKRKYRQNPNARAAYVSVLISLGLHNKAAEVILETSGKNRLITFYPYLKSLKPTLPNAIKAQLEQSIKQAPDNKELLSVYAHFCATNNEVELALLTLQKLCSNKPKKQDLKLLSELYEQRGESQLALQTVNKLHP